MSKEALTKRRVVVTGLGVLTAIGSDLKSFEASLREGRSGVGPIQSFDNSAYNFPPAYELKNFDAKALGLKLLDPFIQYAVWTAEQAVSDAGFEIKKNDPFRIGLAVSSSKGGVHTISRFKERLEEHPSAIMGARVYTSAVPNFAAQWIARKMKIQGAAKCYVAACATGTMAVLQGMRMVSEGTLDYCIAGASDSSLSPLLLAGYRNMKALASEAIRPFDKRRDGFLVGEGAAMLFLETLESARERGAKIYAEILEGTSGQNISDPIRFDPAEHALSKTTENIFRRGRINAQDVDYVNLHGTGTPHGDVYETLEMKKIFGDRAKQVPMSSIKSMTGHMLGASGAVEAAAVCLAISRGFIPPTAGLEERDPDCDLDYVPLRSREKKIKKALSVSMGFGGHVAGVLFGDAAL